MSSSSSTIAREFKKITTSQQYVKFAKNHPEEAIEMFKDEENAKILLQYFIVASGSSLLESPEYIYMVFISTLPDVASEMLFKYQSEISQLLSDCDMITIREQLIENPASQALVEANQLDTVKELPGVITHEIMCFLRPTWLRKKAVEYTQNDQVKQILIGGNGAAHCSHTKRGSLFNCRPCK